jgi:hypothetical protein
MKVPACEAGNSQVNVWPGSTGGWVNGGTPSIVLGTCRPCQWMLVAWRSSFRKMTRSVSPSVTRISGPGTWPL